MSVQNTRVGVSLHDLLTRIIPGSVVIGPGVFSLFIVAPDIFQDTGTFLLIFGIGSFLAGEAIEILRSAGFRTPLPFLQMVYRITGNEEKLSYTQQKILALEQHVNPYLPSRFKTGGSDYLEERLNIDFRASMEDELEIDFDVSEPRDIYDFLILKLEPNMSPQTKRYRSLSIFTSNLRIASVVSTVCYLLLYASSRLSGSSSIELTLAMLTSILILFYAWPITQIFGNASYLYLEGLLKEYYSQSLSESRALGEME